VSFLLAFAGAGILRWHVLGHHRLVEVGADLLVQWIILALVGERRSRSSGLSCALLGVSTGLDLVVSLSYLAGVLHSISLPGNLGLQVFLSVVACIQFHREPMDVQSHGYRAPRGPLAV
jgi:uncharacterized membrane protein